MAPLLAPRLSRSQWMAVGSALATMGCMGQGAPQPEPTTPDTETVEASTSSVPDANEPQPTLSDAADETLVDASSDAPGLVNEAGPKEAGSAGPCGANCNGWNQLCIENLSWVTPDPQCVTVTSEAGDADAPLSAAEVQTCDEAVALSTNVCAGYGPYGYPVCNSGTEYCVPDDCTPVGGNVYQVGSCYSVCYGAPPARLDRFLDV